jgi:hypothetical protein
MPPSPAGYRRPFTEQGGLSKNFLLGFLTEAPVLIVALPIQHLGPKANHPMRFGLWSAVLGAAVPEEFFEFLVVIRYRARR